MYRMAMFTMRSASGYLLNGRNKWSAGYWIPKMHTFRDFGKYSIVKPGKVSPRNSVPDHIDKPDYYFDGGCSKPPKEIEIKNKNQINKMRLACKLARKILDEVGNTIKVGMTTDEIDKMVHNMTINHGAYPSPLNYSGFPKSVCTSVNNVACHGIPDDRPLHNGDIITVDVTVYLNGYHGDCSATFLVGDVDREGIRLAEATYQALMTAISYCRPGEHFCTIGEVVEAVAKNYNYSIVPIFTGHGIGSYFHGPPDVFHCYNDVDLKMSPGMTFTIEPLLSQGTSEAIILEDNWTAITADDSRAAQWEHTVLITKNGAEILTE